MKENLALLGELLTISLGVVAAVLVGFVILPGAWRELVQMLTLR